MQTIQIIATSVAHLSLPQPGRTSSRMDVEPNPLLQFLDTWADLNSREVTFEKLIKGTDGGSTALGLLRDLDGQRRSTVNKMSTIKDRIDDEHISRFEGYLNLLNIISREDVDAQTAKFDWTMPMAGRPSNAFYRISGIKQEQVMATFQFGAALRVLAFQLAQQAAMQAAESASSSSSSAVPDVSSSSASLSSSSAGPLQEAVTHLRKAAGVYQWLAERACPAIATQLPGERHPELCTSMSRCFSSICLAEAQSLTAYRAGQRKGSPGLTAALHLGASNMYEEAAKILKQSTGDFNTVSERLRRYIALSSTLSKARAYKWLGEELRNQGQAGQGEAACLEAASQVQRAAAVAELDAYSASWRPAIKKEAESAEAFRKKSEKDRVNVYYQTVASKFPDLPEAKVLVKPLPYEPISQSTAAEVAFSS